VDELVFTVYGRLALSDVCRGIWEPVIPHLARSAASGDPDPLFDAIENAARSAGLSQSVPVAVLLEEFTLGSRAMCDELGARDTAEARAVRQFLRAFESVALARIATGYAVGLEETIARLRHDAEEASPLDHVTGAMKPAEIVEQLSLEVNRCQRMDLSLGLLELAPEKAERVDVPARFVEDHRGIFPKVGDCLRENLRRYDSIGLTGEGGFLLVLPDISRRGLAGAAERLRRELAASAGSSPLPRFLFALAHYDYVSAGEMLEALDDSMRRARAVHEPLTWS